MAKLNKDEALYRESFEKYASAVKYKEDKYEAYGSWGLALIGLGKLRKEKSFYEEALRKFEKGIEIRKDDPDIWYFKACAYSLLEEKNNTLESLKRAIELDSKFKEIAKKDEDFRDLWNDKDFKKLVE